MFVETRVYRVGKDVADEILENPDVKRFGEARKFDPEVLGLGGGSVVLVVRGDDRVFSLELLKGLEEAKNREEILRRVRELDDAAATGVGMLFG